jgi:hypothetical protein
VLDFTATRCAINGHPKSVRSSHQIYQLWGAKPRLTVSGVSADLDIASWDSYRSVSYQIASKAPLKRRASAPGGPDNQAVPP